MIFPYGVITGLTLGIIARAWMRWISTDPEFTWSGTIFIILAFTFLGGAQSLVALARSRWSGHRRIFIARVFGAIFSLGIFFAAGAQMFPSVILWVIGVWRTDLSLRLRALLLALGFVVPVGLATSFIIDFGWTGATIGRIVLFLLIYATIVYLAKPTISPLPEASTVQKAMSTLKRIFLLGGIIVLAAGSFLLTVGITGD
ncbi:MAG: hypothetical protein WDO06_03285 [Actinomycetota bacterium]